MADPRPADQILFEGASCSELTSTARVHPVVHQPPQDIVISPPPQADFLSDLEVADRQSDYEDKGFERMRNRIEMRSESSVPTEKNPSERQPIEEKPVVRQASPRAPEPNIDSKSDSSSQLIHLSSSNQSNVFDLSFKHKSQGDGKQRPLASAAKIEHSKTTLVRFSLTKKNFDFDIAPTTLASGQKQIIVARQRKPKRPKKPLKDLAALTFDSRLSQIEVPPARVAQRPQKQVESFDFSQRSYAWDRSKQQMTSKMFRQKDSQNTFEIPITEDNSPTLLDQPVLKTSSAHDPSIHSSGNKSIKQTLVRVRVHTSQERKGEPSVVEEHQLTHQTPASMQEWTVQDPLQSSAEVDPWQPELHQKRPQSSFPAPLQTYMLQEDRTRQKADRVSLTQSTKGTSIPTYSMQGGTLTKSRSNQQMRRSQSFYFQQTPQEVQTQSTKSLLSGQIANTTAIYSQPARHLYRPNSSYAGNSKKPFAWSKPRSRQSKMISFLNSQVRQLEEHDGGSEYRFINDIKKRQEQGIRFVARAIHTLQQYQQQDMKRDSARMHANQVAQTGGLIQQWPRQDLAQGAQVSEPAREQFLNSLQARNNVRGNRLARLMGINQEHMISVGEQEVHSNLTTPPNELNEEFYRKGNRVQIEVNEADLAHLQQIKGFKCRVVKSGSNSRSNSRHKKRVAKLKKMRKSLTKDGSEIGSGLASRKKRNQLYSSQHTDPNKKSSGKQHEGVSSANQRESRRYHVRPVSADIHGKVKHPQDRPLSQMNEQRLFRKQVSLDAEQKSWQYRDQREPLWSNSRSTSYTQSHKPKGNIAEEGRKRRA